MGRLAAAWRALLALFILAFPATTPRAQDAVCAQVKIEIKQKLSLERQAFDAVMRIDNGLDTDSITSIGVNLTFQDDAGNAVIGTTDPNNLSATFFLRIDSLTGINAIDGTGSVAPKTTGEIHWLIIPAQGAGGIAPQGKLYFVGASLTYTALGNTSTIAVTPDFITVKPQPLLALDYFLAGDVYADDPFTPQVEPPVPFTLGVRIKNVGGGTAAKTTIESAQPKIIDNKQGLLIGFQILDSYVNDQPAAPTLLINFGDIAPGASAVGRWDMVTTLSGKFIDLQAGYTHADSLGGALTSLIQGVSTHLLVHDVKVDLPGRDNVRDFLALDVDVLRVYESEGVDTQVTDQSGNASLTRQSSGTLYDLAFPATVGFAYVKLNDPFAGQVQPGAVLRSDGKTLPVENVWLSKTRNANLTWSYYINFFDANTTGRYTVQLAGTALSSIAGVVYADGNNNGVQDAGDNGIGATAVTLTGTDDLGAAVNTTGFTAPDGSFSFVQLRPGTYSLKVAAVAGYSDGILGIGTAGGSGAGDTISGIALAAGTQATGYLFAKRAVAPPPTQADVSLTMSASATVVPSGSNVTLTLKAANAGPAIATSARVTDVLPATLSLQSAAASTGSFDSTTGVWSVGDLAIAANATLTIVAKVTSITAPIVNSATIASTLTDPDNSNNSASVTLNPDAGSLDVTQSIPREARVLAFVDCPSASPPGSDPACTAQRVTFLAGYLGGMGYDVNVVTDVDAFTSWFRSGRYNTYWLSADAAMTALVMREIGEAVLRGDTLIFDGPDATATVPLDEATGVVSGNTSVGTNVPIDLVGSATVAANPPSSGAIATVGTARKLTLAGGLARATFGTRTHPPAIVTNAFGQGFGLVAAFDLIGTLQISASEQALHALIVEALATLAPQVPAAFVGDSYVALGTSIDNLAGDATVEVISTLPAGVTLADAKPAPTSVSGSDVTWRFALPAQQSALIDLGVRAPLVSGSYPVSTTVNKVFGATTTPYGSYNTTIVVGAADVFGPKLVPDLKALALTDLNEKKARDLAVTLLVQAQAALADNRYDKAFRNFINAGEALGAITSVNVAAYVSTIDNWLKEVEQRWYLGLPVCGSADVTPQVVNGATFTPFDENEGFELRGGRRSQTVFDWAFSLGADREQYAKSSQQGFAWVTGNTYSWSLTYDGQGGGTYSLSDAGTTLVTRSYSGAAGKLRTGNALELDITAKPAAGTGRIDADNFAINGNSVGSGIFAVGTQQPGESFLYFYHPPMAGGFQLSGSIKLTFTTLASLLNSRLDFTVTAGNSLCRPPAQ
jgi:uncharacterized repeat protein (TIGR01451 family)